MGVNFVIIFENRAGRSEEEINRTFGTGCIPNEWVCFSYEGGSYVSWCVTPRYFYPEDDPERWEALRKFLVRVREFLGGGEIYLGNDVINLMTPEDATEDREFFLPMAVPEEWLLEPDAKSQPELARIQELEGLIW